MKITKWFDKSIHPVRDGVYQWKPSFPRSMSLYSYWANGQWHIAGTTPELAHHWFMKGWISKYPSDWRGVLK